jgi:light-regulated signal transduction histidine kinase (bacteriophytochrome)
MGDSDQDRAAAEIERLRQALDVQTQQCLDLQRQLNRANAEFEEFVSTAVHDLREPLRGVASYSQLLAETCAGRLDSEAGAILGQIQENAARMQSLSPASWTTGLLVLATGTPPGRTWTRCFSRRSSSKTS